MRKLLLCLFIVIMAMPAYAATFRVERDGSADYAVIQDAVNAAASGDTILIGPGRYNEGEMITTGAGTEFVRVLVHQNELTLIGAGPNETILGPTTPFNYDTQGDDRGINAGPYFGCNSLRVENIGFENMGRGIRGCNAPDYVVVENCRFGSNNFGLSICSGSTVEVNSCIFNLAVGGGNLIILGGTDFASITNCEFVYEENPLFPGILVQMQGVGESNVHNCTFSEGHYGLRFFGSTESARVTGCQFTGQSREGLGVGSCDVAVDNCIFEQQEKAVGVYTLSTNLTFSNSAIMDVNDVSFYIYGVDGFEVTNSIIAHGPEFSVRQPEYQGKETGVDLRQLIMINNDWGTTDAETIASWISLRDYEAQYIPFIGQPVATEAMTFDGLKALFR